MKKYQVNISDVHGQNEVLISLISHLEKEYGKNNLHYNFLGDLIDKGPDSIGTLFTVHDLYEDGNADVFLGNHEWMLINTLKDPLWINAWIDDGGEPLMDILTNHTPTPYDACHKILCEKLEPILSLFGDMFYDSLVIKREIIAGIPHTYSHTGLNPEIFSKLNNILTENKTDKLNQSDLSFDDIDTAVAAGCRDIESSVLTYGGVNIFGHTAAPGVLYEHGIKDSLLKRDYTPAILHGRDGGKMIAIDTCAGHNSFPLDCRYVSAAVINTESGETTFHMANCETFECRKEDEPYEVTLQIQPSDQELS